MPKKVVINIKNLAQTRGISLRELSRITDIRHAALSELCSQKRENINFSHIEKIADALNISDLRDIIDIVDLDN